MKIKSSYYEAGDFGITAPNCLKFGTSQKKEARKILSSERALRRDARLERLQESFSPQTKAAIKAARVTVGRIKPQHKAVHHTAKKFTQSKDTEKQISRPSKTGVINRIFSLVGLRKYNKV